MLTHRLRGNRDDLTALHWSNLRLFYGGWGGIRTPGGVAPTTVFKTVAIDRSATHPKLFPAGLSNLRFCSLFAPDGAAHHSFALDCAALVLLTRMQDRRNRPLCHPSETVSRRSFNLRFCSLFAPGGAAHHSFALDCAALVLLTRMQDRRNRPRLSPIRNCFPPGCLISVAYYTVLTYRCQFICLLYYFLPVFAIMLYYIQTGER